MKTVFYSALLALCLTFSAAAEDSTGHVKTMANIVKKLMRLETEFKRGNIGQEEVQTQSVFAPELARLLFPVVL